MLNRFINSFFLSILALGFTLPAFGQAGDYTVRFTDPQGYGFNDTTPVAPVGGNTGATLGAQRKIALNFALQELTEHLNSPVSIDIKARFVADGGTEYSSTLASAGPTFFIADFHESVANDIFYPPALANKIAGKDVTQVSPYKNSEDIVIEYNSDVDGSALGSSDFYYGLDRLGSRRDIDFITVTIHEMTHGLGLLSTISSSTGAKTQCNGCGDGIDDIYSKHIAHATGTPSSPKIKPIIEMGDQLRYEAIGAKNQLVWTAPMGRAASAQLVQGTTLGYPRIEASAARVSGSNLSHLDSSMKPAEMSTPVYSGPLQLTPVTLGVLADLGWGLYTDIAIYADEFITDANSQYLESRITLANEGAYISTDNVINITVTQGAITTVNGNNNIQCDPIIMTSEGSQIVCHLSQLLPNEIFTFNISVQPMQPKPSNQFINLKAQLNANIVDPQLANNRVGIDKINTFNQDTATNDTADESQDLEPSPDIQNETIEAKDASPIDQNSNFSNTSNNLEQQSSSSGSFNMIFLLVLTSLFFCRNRGFTTRLKYKTQLKTTQY